MTQREVHGRACALTCPCISRKTVPLNSICSWRANHSLGECLCSHPQACALLPLLALARVNELSKHFAKVSRPTWADRYWHRVQRVQAKRYVDVHLLPRRRAARRVPPSMPDEVPHPHAENQLQPWTLDELPAALR
eukprot:739803-Amphidinium_carterae.1